MDPEKITYFGETDARNKRVKFGIKAKDRTRHIYLIGKTGMGKSTLLENMAIQDLRNGEGFAILDPHGKTAELLLDYVPPERMQDVVYFAPFDTEYPISFNVLEDVGPDKRHLVVSGLMSTFKKIWVDAWSARMEYILTNTLLALIEYPDATLLGVNRMFTDKDYRKKVVDNIKDTSVKSFWVDEYAKYTDKFAAEATPAIQNKIGQFTANPLIRDIVGQPKSSIDIRKLMDDRKILIINLSKGKVGEANANLLGSMLITKIYLAAMSRADVHEKELKKLPNFYLYVDEFQSFANESFADILSEARKYKLNLTIAHQYIEQMSEEVRAAVFGNVGTMITFRVGAFDAEMLEKEFAPQFTAEDLVNLGIYQMYLKLMIDGVSSSPFSASSLPPFPEPVISYKREIIEHSRTAFAKPRKQVEENIEAWYVQGKQLPKVAVTPQKPFGEKKIEQTPIAVRESKPREVSAPVVAPIPSVSVEPKQTIILEKKKYDELPTLETEASDDFMPLGELVKKVTSVSLPRPKQEVFAQKEKRPTGQKTMSKENLLDLRSALESVMKNTPIQKKEEATKEPETKKEEVQQETPKEDPEKTTEAKIPHNLRTAEIPENELKKILGLE